MTSALSSSVPHEYDQSVMIYFLSECSLASPGSPCTNLEADDCNYEYFHFLGNLCCCGQCTEYLDPRWLSLACVLNSTTGDRVWKPKDPIILCPAEGCGSDGEWFK